jgi:hypothetical protein
MTCPGCGVPVTVGYPRCPKCGAGLPAAARSKRATFREANLEGGTSVEPESSGGSGGWILAGVLLVLGVGMAIYFATRGGGKKHDAEAGSGDEATQVEDQPNDEPNEVTPDEPDEKPAQKPGPKLNEPRAAAVADVVARIDEGLRTARLWAKVQTLGDVLVIESSLCDDPGILQVVSGEGDALRAAELATVRCQEPNGRVDFERGL